MLEIIKQLKEIGDSLDAGPFLFAYNDEELALLHKAVEELRAYHMSTGYLAGLNLRECAGLPVISENRWVIDAWFKIESEQAKREMESEEKYLLDLLNRNQHPLDNLWDVLCYLNENRIRRITQVHKRILEISIL
jgi:hypothetical protein